MEDFFELNSYLINGDGENLNIFSPKNLNRCGKIKLPDNFVETTECKNCQVSPSSYAIGDLEGNIFLGDLSKGSKFEELPKIHSEMISCLNGSYDLNGDSGFLVAASYDDGVSLWNLRKTKENRLLKDFKSHSAAVNCAIFLNSNNFASGSDDFKIKMYDIEKLKVIHTFESSYCVDQVVYSEALLYSNSLMGIDIYDMRTKKELNVDMMADIGDYDISPNVILITKANNFFTGLYDGNVVCLDLRKLDKPIFVEQFYDGPVVALIDNDQNLENTIISGGLKGLIKIIDIKRTKVLEKEKEKQNAKGVFGFNNVLVDHKRCESAKIDMIERIKFVWNENLLSNNFLLKFRVGEIGFPKFFLLL